jgi:hypothetical protein
MYDDRITVGSMCVSWCEFYDPRGGPIDPDTGLPMGEFVDPDVITVTWKAPDGTVTTYSKSELTLESTGTTYRSRHKVTQPGQWWITWEASGQHAGVREFMISVLPRETP